MSLAVRLSWLNSGLCQRMANPISERQVHPSLIMSVLGGLNDTLKKSSLKVIWITFA